MARKELRNLNTKQWNAILACYLGWTLDAFDYFILIFVFPDIGQTFGVEHTPVTYAVWLTLAMRPVGAFLFGMLADRFGRRPTLMLDIICYSVLGFASGFVTSLGMLYLVRALFGIAMGGEWGVGASLTMETIPPSARGIISGFLQAGYPSGYLLASIVYALLFDHIGWRGMFMIGALPALLVFFIRSGVDESPAWLERKPNTKQIVLSVTRHLPLFIFVVLLMTAFNFYSHGTQDSYPAFLKVQHKFNSQIVGTVTAIASIGAILGGIVFGQISQQIGRRKAIVVAALLSLLVIPMWAFSETPMLLAIGAFIMQFMVQGAWGVIPAHLNELSPPEVRGTFPGFAYQLGNFFAAANLTIQAELAKHFGGNYGISMAIISGLIGVAVAAIAGFGPQAKEVVFTHTPATEAE
jgi:SHS family lactate transporter-like MFS transporter